MLPDMQKSEPQFKTPIYRVGIKNLKLPIFITEKSGGQQHSVANVDVFVDLDDKSKGTHMSRLCIGAHKFMNYSLSKQILFDICKYIQNKVKSKSCQMIYKFPYFIKSIAPESKEPGLTHCIVSFDLTYNNDNDYIFKLSVSTTATSLCPCSKEISNNGAHNQRSKIKITCIPENDYFLWIEDLIEISNLSSSCEIYSVLKRIDEKYVTEKAYENPNFVEDMVRKINYYLTNLPLIDYTIEVQNEESIHQHDAYACIRKENSS